MFFSDNSIVLSPFHLKRCDCGMKRQSEHQGVCKRICFQVRLGAVIAACGVLMFPGAGGPDPDRYENSGECARRRRNTHTERERASFSTKTPTHLPRSVASDRPFLLFGWEQPCRPLACPHRWEAFQHHSGHIARVEQSLRCSLGRGPAFISVTSGVCGSADRLPREPGHLLGPNEVRPAGPG